MKIYAAADANRLLRKNGFGGLEVAKCEGIYYLLGDEGVVDHTIERCLHVTHIAELRPDWLLAKAKEITTG